jgi:trans-2,3-dihydro-3-hydroxyanthranilate isomerase
VPNPFFVVDVFAETKYQGNQLAVVNAHEPLTDAQMQSIAAEFHFSETTFILSEVEHNGSYDVRFFTPKAEVPFAGHPTLGTAHVIRQEIIGTPVKKVVLNLKVGQIPVTFSDGRRGLSLLWMRQNAPVFGKKIDPAILVAALGLPVTALDSRFPVREVSTGLPFVIAPLKTLKAVQNISIDSKKFAALVKNLDAKAVLVFSPQTVSRSCDLHVRVFADYYGVPEDPATGSANGCLAGYLVKYRYFGGPRVNVKVEQGIEVGRPSMLHLKASETKSGVTVLVGGKVIPVAKGELI